MWLLHHFQNFVNLWYFSPQPLQTEDFLCFQLPMSGNCSINFVFVVFLFKLSLCLSLKSYHKKQELTAPLGVLYSYLLNILLVFQLWYYNLDQQQKSKKQKCLTLEYSNTFQSSLLFATRTCL